MAIESQNIYKNARKSAGFTQEKASQLLNVSVDSLRDYEQSQRPVPSDVASAMCDVYQAPYLAVQHLRLTSDLGKRVVPEIQLKDLPEAVLGVLAAAYRLLRRVEHGQNFRKKDRLHLHRRAELFERHSIQPRGYGCRSLPP